MVSNNVIAESLATCGEEVGKAYYVAAGAVSKKDAGWTDDKISGGSVTLDFSEESGLDLLFIDANKVVKSAKSEGAKIKLLALSTQNINVLITYQGNTSEIYDFYVDDIGNTDFNHVVVKPANTLVPKAGIYVGHCSKFNIIPFLNWLE